MFLKLKKLNSLGISLLTSIIIAVCSQLHSTETLPRVVLEESIAQCKYVTIVEGNSGPAKLMNWENVAKQAALQQAAKIGASHIVWMRTVTLAAGSGIVIGKAYRCGHEAIE
jgi:hypothetical protein